MGSSSAQSFTTIPVLDFSLSASPDTKPRFLSELRNAVVNVGFFYLVHTPIAPHVQQAFIEKSLAVFDLPLEKKLEIEMVNSKHFLGYSRLGAETTASKTDYREQFDVSGYSHKDTK
jgi:isopenicillin N synthase-like dioxygenase